MTIHSITFHYIAIHCIMLDCISLQCLLMQCRIYKKSVLNFLHCSLSFFIAVVPTVFELDPSREYTVKCIASNKVLL